MTCPKGLRCPLGSSLESLKTGQSSFGETFTPTILPGYWSTEEEPIEVFKCQSVEHCPGGIPGICPGGREGIPCADCPPGTSWSGEECVQCSNGLVVIPILTGIMFFVVLIIVYYVMPPRIRPKATPREALAMCTGVAAGLAQCLAIIGLTSVRWPKAFDSVASSSSVVLLDMETFSVSCMIGGPQWGRYIMSLAVFPLGVLWLMFCFMSSAWLPDWTGGPWTSTRLLNTLGHFLQVGFSTMSALSLQPLMCQEHPNGQHSLLKHAGVFCSTGEHVLMVAGGMAILIFLVVGFLGMCAWAAWHIPRWSLIRPHRIRAFAFLISRFRMDRWWYGVLVLLRGPLLSMCPVLATDFPLAQAAMISGVLIASLLLHMRYTPWKMPLVNLVDGCLQAMLLLLVAITPVDPGSASATEDFHQGIALVMLSCMAFVFCFLAFSVALALLYQVVAWATHRSGGSPLTFTEDFVVLNLGRRHSSAVTVELIKEVSGRLLEMEADKAEHHLDQMHPDDLSRIIDTINLLQTELAPGDAAAPRSSASSRVVSLRKSMTSDMKSDLQPAAMSDEHGGGESMAEGVTDVIVETEQEIESEAGEMVSMVFMATGDGNDINSPIETNEVLVHEQLNAGAESLPRAGVDQVLNGRPASITAL